MVSGKSLFYFSGTRSSEAAAIAYRPLVACSTRISVDTHTDRQNDYRNLRCACAPRVNDHKYSQWGDCQNDTAQHAQLKLRSLEMGAGGGLETGIYTTWSGPIASFAQPMTSVHHIERNFYFACPVA